MDNRVAKRSHRSIVQLMWFESPLSMRKDYTWTSTTLIRGTWLDLLNYNLPLLTNRDNERVGGAGRLCPRGIPKTA